jgi:MraZ protein
MFIGSFTYSIDPKGRLSIPVELRKYLNTEANNTFVLTIGTAQCISVYPFDYWKELVQKLNTLNTFDPEAMLFARMLTHDAFERTLDAQFRLIIPKNLKEYANIQNEVLIKGVIKNIELWNPDVYSDFIKEHQKNFGTLAKEVMKV